MKLLLTSGGLKNKSIIDVLTQLVGKNLNDVSAVYVQTAANEEYGDKSWMIRNLSELVELFKEVEIADIALPKEQWEPKIKDATVIIVGGGNTTYLMKQMKKSGFAEQLQSLLVGKVYVGISAGSMVTTPTTAPNSDNEEKIPALKLVDFGIQPHYKAVTFPLALTKEKVAQRKIDNNIDYPLYALDDQSAISVIDDKIEVLSEGKWDKL